VTAHRIVKEALANACKHAGAGQVVVTLEHTDEAAVVSVDDDGRGIGPDDEDGRPGHLGLRSMRDRAQVAGAVLEVGRREEGGTRVRLSFPLRAAEDDTPRA
jgi:signal transduction histidine kinase